MVNELSELYYLIEQDERHTFDGCINKRHVLKLIEEAKEKAGQKDWIPCNEKMPTEEGSYWVQDAAGFAREIRYSEKQNAFIGVVNPVAWRLLPDKWVDDKYERPSCFPTIMPDTIIHCETEAQAKLLLLIAENQDWEWAEGKCITETTHYNHHGSDTCYIFSVGPEKEVWYARKGWCENQITDNVTEVIDFNTFFLGANEKSAPDLYAYDKENILLISKERAIGLYGDNFPVIYLLHDDWSKYAPYDIEELKRHEDLFGVKRTDFEAYVKKEAANYPEQ